MASSKHRKTYKVGELLWWNDKVWEIIEVNKEYRYYECIQVTIRNLDFSRTMQKAFITFDEATEF